MPPLKINNVKTCCCAGAEEHDSLLLASRVGVREESRLPLALVLLDACEAARFEELRTD